MSDADQIPNAGPRRILLIRPSALGDVCRTVPCLVSVRRAFPDARIDWLVQSDFTEAVEAHPDLDEVVPFDRKRFGRWWRSPRAARELRRWVRELRRREYDLVLDLQGLGRSGLFAFLTRAPERVGSRGARELAWLGYTRRHDPPRARHAVDRMLELLADEGIEPEADMRLFTPPRARESWSRDRDAAGLRPGEFALLAPTSRWASKRWPVERWRELLEPLASLGFDRSLVVGAPGEEGHVRTLVQTGPPDRVVDRVGRLGVGELMAAVEDAGLVVANDSAALHIAVGFDRPLVGVYGPTDPDEVGPYGRAEAVVRPPERARREAVHYRDAGLGDRPMRAIATDAVLAKVREVLARRSPVARAEGAA